MTEIVHTELPIGDDHLLRVFYDECPESPRENANLTKIIAFGRYAGYSDRDIVDHHMIPGDWKAVHEYIRETWEPVYMEQLTLYDHSAISLGTGTPRCQWDSRAIGYVFVPAADAQHLSNDKIREIVQAELQEYTDYINGEVFGYKLYELKKCECCEHVAVKVVVECHGFIGSDHRKNGLYEHVGICSRCHSEMSEQKNLCRSCLATHYGELAKCDLQAGESEY